MIRTFSQRLSPPFSGMAQIAQSDRARAVTLDSNNWEIHFMWGGTPGQSSAQGTFRRVAYLPQAEMAHIAEEGTYQGQPIDERIVELAGFLRDARLPFPATDVYEYWLLDPRDESPLALIFSCSEASQMNDFPDHPEWTALSAAAMKIDATDDELSQNLPPVNYRLERLVAERAGYKPKARWFERNGKGPDNFPAMMLREDWEKQEDQALCRRYIERQSPRLLMLQSLGRGDRLRLEQASRAHAREVERFFPLYPEVIDNDAMNAIRVEARMRGLSEDKDPLQQRRDGILYI